MNKNYFIGLFLIASFIPIASAQYFGGFWYGTEQVIDSIVFNLEPIFRALLGGQDWTGYLLFEKILLFILISIVVGLILQKLPVFEAWKEKKILRIVSVIIGILAVRNLNYIWVGTILVQYQVLFIAIAGLLPFIIYWYFVKDFDSVPRKVAWVFYAVIYFGLWATTDLQTYNEVYLWAAIGSLVYAFVFDTMVVQWLEHQKIKKQFSRHAWNRIADLNEKISKLERQIAEGHMDRGVGEQQIEDLMRHRNRLSRGKNTY